ncbi:hypothetical protein M378DRAFT_648534 [Amanita muscaria Koide BX008]|uniref:F-box domain-containing protein n=1 Tax=Amanita muscaria (strain Koide BX008) TaxID=946122 RepID=A0A0C2X5F0_AMAMK|nr:hypothetical protein M378DRAFT_648534 [Amanita muscaria Koide BX008]
MLKCRLVNKEFNDIIQSSTLLQYFLACKAAGVIDNPRSPLSYGERLEALLKREDAWRTLKPVFETTIKVNHQPHAIYSLTEGAYFLDDDNQKDMHYCHLPSSPQDNPQWVTIPHHGPGEGSPGIFVNFAIAVYEHDLIINLISSDIGNQTDVHRHSLDLVLLKFSTGEYHPLARHPRIHVQRSLSARPETILEVVGDNLALIINDRSMFTAKLFVFDWKTGHERLQHETTENAYSDLVFVSPEILLVPNLILSHFEVWHLPPSHPHPKPPIQILSLKIPTVSPDYSLFDVSCRGAPNPFLHSMPYLPPRPFISSPENSIIIANLHFESLQGYRNSSYTLIMHRRALLQTIQRCTSSSLVEQQTDLPNWLANEDTVHEIADPDNKSVRFRAQSTLVSMIPHPRSSPRTRGFPTSQYDFFQVHWAEWGPPISRWFRVNKTQAEWIMNVTGQRYAFSVPNPGDRRKWKVSVADFNSYNFRKNADMMAQREGEGNNGGSNNEERTEEAAEEELERFDHKGVFSEEVHMGFKCVIYHAPDEYDFDGVLMDEERLLGVKVSTRKTALKYFP